jgi:carboxypeptidase Taq
LLNTTPYQQLETRMERLNALHEATEVLYWDMAAMMPSGGGEARAEQLAALNAVSHNIMTATDLPDLLDAAEADMSLDAWQQANLREIRHRWIKATALSEDLVEALTKASAACEAKWRDARPAADFKSILPQLTQLLALVTEAGQAKASSLGLSLHDALLDDFEPGGRCADIDAVFGDLSNFLPDFTRQVMDIQASQPVVLTPEGPFSTEKQRALGQRLMEVVGFDFDHGRLDVSLHPFCGGVPDDVRITTRYDEADFTSSLMGVLHETGHAMYERGLPDQWRGQPVGQSLGMSTHESQSLLIEMQVCRSAAFLEFAAPIMRETFGGSGPAWESDNLRRLYTRVEPGFIRVDADEVTYPSHVILRDRLEKAILSGDLALAELPGAWNDGMKELLGIEPANDREGCLQDVHWYDGAWGYFPTYTLGAMTAAQLYSAAKEADPTIESGIAGGDFSPLMNWLRANVHGKGRSVGPSALLIEATGKPLDAHVFKAHLKERYLIES